MISFWTSFGLYLLIYTLSSKTLLKIADQGNDMNANEKRQWMLMKKCLLVVLILMLIIFMLNLMLFNLNTGYADTDAISCTVAKL